MSKFGWSYPPGVTGNEPELTGDWGPCECCGRHVDECICPECAVCGEVGRKQCYDKNDPAHGVLNAMEYTKTQLIGQQKLRIVQLEEQLYDAKYALDMMQQEDFDVDYEPNESGFSIHPEKRS